MTSLAATKQPISVQQADANSIKGEHPFKKTSFDAPPAHVPNFFYRSRVSEFVLARLTWQSGQWPVAYS